MKCPWTLTRNKRWTCLPMQISDGDFSIWSSSKEMKKTRTRVKNSFLYFSKIALREFRAQVDLSALVWFFQFADEEPCKSFNYLSPFCCKTRKKGINVCPSRNLQAPKPHLSLPVQTAWKFSSWQNPMWRQPLTTSSSSPSPLSSQIETGRILPTIIHNKVPLT